MVFVLSLALVLSGCSFGSSVEKMLSKTMTEMNTSEKEYRDGQAELTELEKSEQELFNETMELTQEQKDVLKTNVAELEDMLEQRLALIEGEEKSMSKARGSMDDLDAIIKEVDETTKKGLEDLKRAVGGRYELHSAFVSEYKQLATLQKELYAMLIAEETKLTELRDKVDEVNAKNEKVESAVTSFNDATGKVNVMKDDVLSSLQKEK
jgi:chromosome segregation ATPase